MRLGVFFIPLALGLALLAGGCGRPAGGDDGGRGYRIVATVGMVTDIVRNVAGERARVHGLMGEGVDPHLYRPTRDDVAALMRADVVFYCGLMLEGKMGEAMQSLSRQEKPVHAVAEAIDPQYLLRPPGGGHYDPHLWMDPTAWARAVDVVAAVLAEFDADNADYYRANAEHYKSQLRDLDDYARRAIATIPETGRVLITAHDAFGYFGRAYGVEVLGIQGLSTESEAGLQDIRRLLDLIVERKISAVFVESSVSAKNITALVEGARARGHALAIGGELYSDAMGPAGTYEGTYIGMIDHNVTTIVRALGGQAPAGGMQGRLGHGR
jgi:manganese/zinc/iron transport system substrate-binding protein